MKSARRLGFAIAILFASTVAAARGVSPYLPLDLSPGMERQIERVLILAGKPVMRRPIAAATVLDALPTACQRDRTTCEQVRRYLQSYMRNWGITSLRVQGAVTSGDVASPLPNRHGEPIDSEWRVSGHGFFQFNDYILLNAGGIAHDEHAIPTGSYLSLGFEYAQLDIGWRDHWLSPMTDSASLISTEAPTMPSVTLSNYEPITPLDVSYEVFLAEMSRQDGIIFNDTTTAGNPRLAGLQLVMEPVRGYGVAVGRVTQYGGGARGGSSLSDFIDALLTGSNRHDVSGDPEETNRVASLASSIQFPGKVPFAVTAEYAGEDNTFEGRYRLGATNFSLGLDFPLLWRHFDASIEISEWQNVWYTHHLYPRGLTHRGLVIGHWFGDHRLFADALGGRSSMLRAGWSLPNGAYAQARYRSLDLDERWAFSGVDRPYRTMHMLELTYSTAWKDQSLEAQLLFGRDVFGDSFARVSAAFDFAAAPMRGARAVDVPSVEDSGVEIFVDIGAQYSRTREYLFLEFQPRATTSLEPNVHIGVGARRRVSMRNDLGFRVEADRVDGHNLLSFRALDYRFRFAPRFAVGAFFGVGRYDLTLPAYGYYMGAGLQYRDVRPGWDLSLEYHHYDKLTRDKGLMSDPVSNPGMPRRAIDIHGYSLFISKRW